MGRAALIIRKCQWCGRRLPAGRKTYCNSVCQGNGYRRDACKTGSGPVPPTPYKPRPKKIILSDAQQREIDQAVAESHKMELSSRVLRPGDPDFDALAKQCTPPHLIPNHRPVCQQVSIYGVY